MGSAGQPGGQLTPHRAKPNVNSAKSTLRQNIRKTRKRGNHGNIWAAAPGAGESHRGNAGASPLARRAEAAGSDPPLPAAPTAPSPTRSHPRDCPDQPNAALGDAAVSTARAALRAGAPGPVWTPPISRRGRTGGKRPRLSAPTAILQRGHRGRAGRARTARL